MHVLFTRHNIFPNYRQVLVTIRSVVLVMEAKRMPNLVQYATFATRDCHVASIWRGWPAWHVSIFSSARANRNDLTTPNTANAWRAPDGRKYWRKLRYKSIKLNKIFFDCLVGNVWTNFYYIDFSQHTLPHMQTRYNPPQTASLWKWCTACLATL